MESSKELIAAQNEVQAQIGRNLLNYQIIEGRMKAILMLGNLEVKRNVDGRLTSNTSSQWKTLGNLFRDYITDHVEISTETISAELEADSILPEGILLRVKFTEHFESAEHLAEWDILLKQLSKDRNELVHHFFQRFKMNSLENCREALGHLKLRRDFSAMPFDKLRNILLGLHESYQEFNNILASDNFFDTNQDITH
ncbi:MAG: hypothetical protein KA218_06685 [Arenimonas sp.]|nr:hypothetical protein [Arenimonas sp.]